jgi:prolyl oligopeptidase
VSDAVPARPGDAHGPGGAAPTPRGEPGPLPARRVDQVDDYHGELVADPYRWLEDTNAPDTQAWVAAENELTDAWLAAVPAREEIRERLTELWDYPRVGAPFERGGRWFQLRNTGLQNQDVLYVMDSPEAPGDQPEAAGRVLLDPNALSSDGTVALTSFAVTDDGARLAYATSSAGSDWMTWRVRDTATGEDHADVIEWSKYSDAAWLKDGSGFYYGAVDPPAPGAEYLDAVGLHRLFFHRLGTDQDADELIFAAPEEPEWMGAAEVSDDGRYVVITIEKGTAPETQLRVLDREDPAAGLTPLVAEFAAKAAYVTNLGSTFYLLTDDGAERQRVVAVELENPARAGWREVIPESADLLLDVRHYGGRLVCHYLRDACSALAVFGLDGTPDHDIPVPAVSSLTAGFTGAPESSRVHFAVSSFIDSGSVWTHDLESQQTRQLTRPAAAVDPAAFVSEQVFVTADDGVSVPLFLTRRADVAPNGDAPVLLYGYGGFDIPMTPSFSVSRIAFIERGGVLAVAALRGGGEYGRAWHQAGILERKQRVFDDFAGCARWLVGAGWSRPERIAIQGGSNGGLLVGASITQHPELFGAAVAEVGVLDMLRFHRFTIGWAWKSDYGDPDDPAQYPALRAYSPLHNIVPGRRYPPILITTGDHDDRVVPGHSFKFAATLQWAAAASAGESGRAGESDGAAESSVTGEAAGGPPAPVLLRTETSAGHGHGLPTVKAIAKATDVLAFLAATVGASQPG